MKKILFAFCLALLQVCAFSQTPFTAPWGFNYSAPTGAPSALGTRVRLDITTGRIYTWSPDALNWQLQGYTIDQISGTSAPAYAPVRGQSWFAVNGDTLPRLYQYTGTGTVWKCLNCSDGKTYTAGTGITLSGPNSTVINNAGDLSATNELNTGFDISGGNLRIIDAGATRTVAVTSIAPDQSVTNEIQTIDTFLVSGSNLLLSLTQDNQPAKTITLPASGITALTGDVTASGPGSAVATIAAGAVTGAKLAANSVDSTKITPLSIANSDIANVAPEKLLQKGASTGQVLGWNGSIWGPTAAGVSGSGTAGFLPKFSSSTGLTNSAFDENTASYITSTTRGITVGDAVSSSAAGNGFRLLRGTLSGGYFSNGSQLIFQTSSNHDIYFATNGTERMRILAGGNVGVGTNSPNGLIHLLGNATINAVMESASNADVQFQFRANAAPKFLMGYTSTNGFRIYNYGTATASLFVESTTSNVGISTTSPGARIHIVGVNATSANNALLVQNSTPSDLLTIRNDGKTSLWATNTATGTTGAQTINRPSGTVNFAAGATTLVVTNSLVTTSSLVFPIVRTNDATATVKNIVCAAGSFTITLTAAATAETSVGFFVIN